MLSKLLNKKSALIISIYLLNIQITVGQVIFPASSNREYYELLLLKNEKLNDPITLTPSVITEYGITDSTLIWDLWGIKNQYISQNEKLFVINPKLTVVHNTKYAKSENNGAAWNGKGLNTSLNFGIGGVIGILHYVIAPSLNYSQNKEYYIPESDFSKENFSYPFENNLDWVLRFGDDSYYNFDFGQTEVRLVYKNATIGVSNQNMKWGPAKYYPILMSNNAAGFPHIDIGTKAPIKSIIGDIEFKTYYGILTGSDYFKTDKNRNKSYFLGLTFGYQPKYIPGLSIGLNRAMYRDLSLRSLNSRDFFRFFSGIDGGDDIVFNGQLVNDLFDQLISATLKWVFVEVGFEGYLEIARNDFSGGKRDKFLEPGHSRGYTVGFVKILDLKNGDVFKFNYEHSTINLNATTLLRPTNSFYVHHMAQNGYTNKGQLIGAGIGPGSNADFIDINYFYKTGLFSLKIQRINFNIDYFLGEKLGRESHDAEYSLTLKFLKQYKRFQFDLAITASKRLNWYYELENDAFNFQSTVNLIYKLK